MNKIGVAIGVLLIMIGASITVYGFNKFWKIENVGLVHNSGVEVYWYSNLTLPCTLIDWGMIWPNQSYFKTVYLYNPGNTPIMVNWTAGNWDPIEAKDYILVTLPTDQYIIGNGTVSLNIDLRVANDITNTNITSFRFDINILGTQITP